jgi:hypothetical protein
VLAVGTQHDRALILAELAALDRDLAAASVRRGQP